MSNLINDLIDRYHAQRAKAWPLIETFFDNLPEPLADIGWQFTQRLARQTAPSGEFLDALKHPAVARVAYLPLWHINAYVNQGDCVRNTEALETHLFASAFLGFCAIRIHDDFLDEDKPDSPVDNLLLANLLSVEATRQLQHIFPSDSPFWNHHLRHWAEYTQAVRLDKIRNRSGLAEFSTTDLLHIGRKAALLKTYPVAVALCFGKEEQIISIEKMMDNFNTAIQINNDIQSIKNDIETPHYTLPLVNAAVNAGFKVGTHPTNDELLCSLALSRAVPDSHQIACNYYLNARNASVSLGIDDLTQFIDWHIEDLQESADHWSGLCVDSARIPSSFLAALGNSEITDHSRDNLSATIDRALAFLNFDPICRESWEVQRTKVWGQDILIGDAFSRSLVCEVLATRGCIPSKQAGEILKQYKQNGWRYYRDFSALPPDIDDIAQSIRLVDWVEWKKKRRHSYLLTPIQWLAHNRNDDGSFPVWMTEGIKDKPETGWIPLGGTHCLGCEANLLEALAGLQKIDQQWLQEGGASLLSRWRAQGTNGIYYYKPAYGIFLIARCFSRLSKDSRLSSRLRNELAHELHRLGDRCNTISAGEHCLSIAAKVMVLALMEIPPVPLISEGLAILMELQSFDGGWSALDFFRCPGSTPNAIGWHSGRTLTTAIVTNALIRGEHVLA